MGKQEYNTYMNDFSNILINNLNLPIHNIYGPLTDKYWEQDYKIVLCNLEPYDPIDKIRKVDIEVFKHWFGAPTIHYAAIIANAIIYNLTHDIAMSEDEVQETFYQYDKLIEAVSKIAYVNIRITDNVNSVAAEYYNIFQELDKTKPYLKKQFDLLKPNVFIIGGVAGCNIVNLIFEPKKILEFRGYTEINKLLLVSMNHMSGQGAAGGWYKMIAENAKQISEYLKKQKTK